MVSTNNVKALCIQDFKAGDVLDFGSICLTEQEIIDFALANDPLDFHIDRDAARKSIFGGIIASGPHVMNVIHKREWIPRFKHTVVCGLGIKDWKFLKPVFPGKVIKCRIRLLSLLPNPEKAVVAVNWYYEFLDGKDEQVQCLEMAVLHKIS